VVSRLGRRSRDVAEDRAETVGVELEGVALLLDRWLSPRRMYRPLNPVVYSPLCPTRITSETRRTAYGWVELISEKNGETRRWVVPVLVLARPARGNKRRSK